MPKETMTPKERWLAVLQRKTPDRVPMDFWGADETMAKLRRHLGCADAWEVYRTLHIDRVVTVGPAYTARLHRPPTPGRQSPMTTTISAAAFVTSSMTAGSIASASFTRWQAMKRLRKSRPTTRGPAPTGSTIR